MKILIKLDSIFFTKRENDLMYDEMIEIEWHLPFLPSKDDLFDVDEIVPEEKLPLFYTNDLSWSVDVINFTKINGVQTPIIWLNGA